MSFDNDYKFVTSFSPGGYEQYGRKFLEGFLKHCKYPLWVYIEGRNVWDEYPGLTEMVEDYENLFTIDLDADPDRAKFLADPRSVESLKQKDYRFQASRFSHKVFALTDPKRIETTEADWWIWLDADIEIFGDIDEAFLKDVCPGGFVGSYLGRKDWDHSECGWVAYGKRYHGFEVLKELRRIYTSGEIYEFSQSHDSFIFDQIKGNFSTSW